MWINDHAWIVTAAKGNRTVFSVKLFELAA